MSTESSASPLTKAQGGAKGKLGRPQKEPITQALIAPTQSTAHSSKPARQQRVPKKYLDAATTNDIDKAMEMKVAASASTDPKPSKPSPAAKVTPTKATDTHRVDNIAHPSTSTAGKFLPFAEAVSFAQGLQLKGVKEWVEWRKSSARPATIPTNPHQIYKYEGWQGYKHWLGSTKGSTTSKASSTPIVTSVEGHFQMFLSYEKAQSYARTLFLETDLEWAAWSSSSLRPANIPPNPELVYVVLCDA